MHVAVCVKQLPDPAAPGRLDPETGTLVREGKFVMDDSDSYGVEMALQLVQAAGGGAVTVISMAPNGETKGVRDALAMGADAAIVVSDEALRGSDALSTAKVLAAAVCLAGRADGDPTPLPPGAGVGGRSSAPGSSGMDLGDVDLILAATESTDGYTGTTPVQVAALLGLPSITFAKKVTTDESAVGGSTVTVERQTDEGYDEVQASLPALVTLTAGVVEPRYPAFKAIMAAKHKPCSVISLADLGLNAAEVGFAGARQEITSVVAAAERTAGDIVEDDGQGHERIVSFLENMKVI